MRPAATADPGLPDRLPGLDLLRAVAVVWVMLFHSWVVGGLGPDWSWLSRFGWMGVDLFFVLSGYLIGGQVLGALAQGRGFSFRDFYLRRASRIVPAYAVVLGLYLAWPTFREAPGLEPWWAFAAFVVNLTIDYEARSAFSHAWSLCVEEHFYAVFPLLALALHGRRWQATAAVMGAVLLGGPAWRSAVVLNAPLEGTRNWFIEDLYYPTWCRLDGLLAGVALAAAQHFRPALWQAARRRAGAAAVLGLLLVALALHAFANRLGLLANSIGWPLLSWGLALLVFAAAGRDNLLGRRWPGVAALAGPLAAASYSLYLVHKAVFHLVQLQWGAALEGRGLLAFAAYGGAALAAGALLHLAVERPVLRWRQHRQARVPPRAGSTTLTTPTAARPPHPPETQP